MSHTASSKSYSVEYQSAYSQLGTLKCLVSLRNIREDFLYSVDRAS
jgi:hypothetical protein